MRNPCRQASLWARDTCSIPVVALDIAGAEHGFPAEEHKEAYSLAHKNFLNKTVHAGEGYGPESIFQAITDLYADRIGHGFHVFSADKIHGATKLDHQKYVENLVQYIAEHRVTMEVCLSSNTQVPLPHARRRVTPHRRCRSSTTSWRTTQ